MACKKNCRKYFLRGENACEKCKDRASCTDSEDETPEEEDEEESEEEESEEEESEEEESEEEDEKSYDDEFGHSDRRHLYRIPFKFTYHGVKYTGKIEVAADSVEEARDFVNETDIDVLFDTSILAEDNPEYALGMEPGFYDIETELVCNDTGIEVDSDGEVETEDEYEEEEESEEEESEEEDDITYSDSFGNENMKHVFTIPVKEFIWKGRKYSGTICVAADTAEDAKAWLEEQSLDDLFVDLDDLECLDGAKLNDEGPVGEDAEHLSCKGDVSDIEETDDEELRD